MDMLSMGGYGGYVWTSYALTLIVVLVSFLQSRRRHRRIRDELTARFVAMEGGHGRASEEVGDRAGEKAE